MRYAVAYFALYNYVTLRFILVVNRTMDIENCRFACFRVLLSIINNNGLFFSFGNEERCREERSNTVNELCNPLALSARLFFLHPYTASARHSYLSRVASN